MHFLHFHMGHGGGIAPLVVVGLAVVVAVWFVATRAGKPPSDPT